MESTVVYWGDNGIMEKKMEATIVYWGYIGIVNLWRKTATVFSVCSKHELDPYTYTWFESSSTYAA